MSHYFQGLMYFHNFSSMLLLFALNACSASAGILTCTCILLRDEEVGRGFY